MSVGPAQVGELGRSLVASSTSATGVEQLTALVDHLHSHWFHVLNTFAVWALSGHELHAYAALGVCLLLLLLLGRGKGGWGGVGCVSFCVCLHW